VKGAKIKEQGAKKGSMAVACTLEALVQALGLERGMVSDLAEAGAGRCQVKVGTGCIPSLKWGRLTLLSS
jgi:hypothetical protein